MNCTPVSIPNHLDVKHIQFVFRTVAPCVFTMPKMRKTHAQVLAVGKDFLKFLEDTGKHDVTNKSEMADIYRNEYKPLNSVASRGECVNSAVPKGGGMQDRRIKLLYPSNPSP